MASADARRDGPEGTHQYSERLLASSREDTNDDSPSDAPLFGVGCRRPVRRPEEIAAGRLPVRAKGGTSPKITALLDFVADRCGLTGCVARKLFTLEMNAGLDVAVP